MSKSRRARAFLNLYQSITKYLGIQLKTQAMRTVRVRFHLTSAVHFLSYWNQSSCSIQTSICHNLLKTKKLQSVNTPAARSAYTNRFTLSPLSPIRRWRIVPSTSDTKCSVLMGGKAVLLTSPSAFASTSAPASTFTSTGSPRAGGGYSHDPTDAMNWSGCCAKIASQSTCI